ncbi:MAG: hypothetical protein LBC39_01120 [Methanobrevibacter sp.]|nr:hypothetical protein [Candidatus Methanovirga aequatorialis]
MYHKEISKINGLKDKDKSSIDLDVLNKILPSIKNNVHGISKPLVVFIKSIKLERLNGNLIFGFYSPVTTAITFTSINTVFTIANVHDKANLSVGADFTKEILDFDGEFIFKIRLLRPILAFLRFITTKSGFKLIMQLKNIL